MKVLFQIIFLIIFLQACTNLGVHDKADVNGITVIWGTDEKEDVAFCLKKIGGQDVSVLERIYITANIQRIYDCDSVLYDKEGSILEIKIITFYSKKLNKICHYSFTKTGTILASSRRVINLDIIDDSSIFKSTCRLDEGINI